MIRLTTIRDVIADLALELFYGLAKGIGSELARVMVERLDTSIIRGRGTGQPGPSTFLLDLLDQTQLVCRCRDCNWCESGPDSPDLALEHSSKLGHRVDIKIDALFYVDASSRAASEEE